MYHAIVYLGFVIPWLVVIALAVKMRINDPAIGTKILSRLRKAEEVDESLHLMLDASEARLASSRSDTEHARNDLKMANNDLKRANHELEVLRIRNERLCAHEEFFREIVELHDCMGKRIDGIGCLHGFFPADNNPESQEEE